MLMPRPLADARSGLQHECLRLGLSIEMAKIR